MTRFPSSGLILSCILSLLAFAPALRAEPATSLVPLTVTPGEYGGGRLYAQARIGNAMGPMRLDTGASTTRVKLAPWNRDFPVLAQSVSTSASGAQSQCQDVEATLVALKAAQGPDIARGKYELSRCATSDGDDLLGLDFFKGARFTLNAARSEMQFFGAPFEGAAAPFRLLGPQQKLIGLDLRSGGVASVGLFDTGAEICAVDAAFVKKNRRLFSPVKDKPNASGASGGRIAARLFKVKEIDLGAGRVARDVYALAYDFGPLRAALGRETSFILGENLLGRFAWELDLTTPGKPMWRARAP